ncbi:hypothetical protein [Streptomyces sp. NBC_01373]|uniref:hypothetical protein n=1 Tax=Streptomyces sp. NBC_01373 TaxID=2903843 RepID=UPI0022574F33|nr:hypothetical protein [Streptomyces sp. NBC_01373]MCX4697055.1 hypothetical protein [Streptomyces sp. NBC_01373]MCX4707020.1 hypothetical protein [Streptomyces sp. NBC_01373]
MATLTLIRTRIASLVARLRRRDQRRTASADSLDTILQAASETGAVVTIPGLLAWLDGASPVDPDFQKSIDSGFTETFDEYCTRISRVAS